MRPPALAECNDAIYAYVVKRTTIYLDEALKRRLEAAARQNGVTEAFVMREALERYLAGRSSPRIQPVGRSTDGGVASHVDQALDELGFGHT